MSKNFLKPADATAIVKKSIKKRRAKDSRLKLYGRFAIGLATCFLLFYFILFFKKVLLVFFNIM